ncbi:uncharacterized protein LOC121641179 [Melanotaenia boesemani]|uniref:uncharacterized protein LOC121641179 n=1 Tax=Melanotaenia boesemani TaxID=1250792 RepID=UPI001C052A43|nr:uncharacterized protein LOC121641179 [Melanotaenia boesemani]
MNLVKNKTLYPHLRDDEALVVENAIRLAIDSILNVLYGVNSARTHEFQRMVADRDKEIQRLECRLTEIEHELQVLRRQGCTCGLFGHEPDPGRSRTSGNRQQREQSGLESGCIDSEVTAGAQECEMSLSVGVFARPPSHVSSLSQDLALLSSPSNLGSGQTCTSRSSEASGVTESAGNLPTSPSSLLIKEEPCDINAVLIEWELSEERLSEQQGGAGSPSQNRESPSEKQRLENSGRTRIRETPQAEPSGLQTIEDQQLGNKKKRVLMSELPEEAQRLKRAAWRAASRRYYARKIARQQANPSYPRPFVHVSAGQDSQLSCLVEKRRTLISDLPADSQTMQREAWRAASRRYYARKTAHHQTESMQFGELLDGFHPSGATQGPNREGPHANGGGIMCS